MIDLAPAGLLRIAFGVLAAGSLLDLAPILTAGFSDQGFLPSDGRFPHLGQLGPLDFGNSQALAIGLWGLMVVGLAAFIAGYHTRLATLVVWLCFSRFTRANPQLFDASDQVIKLVLFFSLFIPLGNRYALDARRARLRGKPLARTGWALPLRVLQLQVCWIYLSTFLLKLPGETWRNGTAVHLALGMTHYFTRPLGHLMLSLPWTTTLATYCTLWVEASFLPLVFWPRLQPRLKALALISGFALHAGILATMCIGGFSRVMIGTYAAFFEPRWVHALAAWMARRLHRAGLQRVADALAPGTVEDAEPLPTRRPWALHAALIAVFVACVWGSAPLPGWATPPALLGTALQRVDLAQAWNMFAPNPGRIDFWLRGVGTLADGREVDALRGDAHGGPMPPPVHDGFGSRWAYVNDVVGWGDPIALRAFGDFLCRHWNARRPAGRAPLVSFWIHSVERDIPLPGEPVTPYREVPYFEHTCRDPAVAR